MKESCELRFREEECDYNIFGDFLWICRESGGVYLQCVL